jgi:hypothetical protein
LIYALSVFSHLDQQLQRDWLVEFRRLLRPRSYLSDDLLAEFAWVHPFDLGSSRQPILQDAYLAAA